MSGKNSDNRKKLILSVVGALVLVVGIPIIINFAYMSGTSHFKTVWDGADVLSYYGVLLGAGATIFAVIATINHNTKIIEKQIRHDASKINSPFFAIDEVNCSVGCMKDGRQIYCQSNHLDYSYNTWDTRYSIELNETEIIRYRFEIRLKNIGEGLSIYTSDDDPEYLTRDNAESILKEQFYEAVFVGEFNIKDIRTIQENENTWSCPQKSIEHKIVYCNMRGIRFAQVLYADFMLHTENALVLEISHLAPQEIIEDEITT